MSRIFAYLRVSTSGQTTLNQLHEIHAAGFAVDEHRVISETVSGSHAAFQREGFAKLVDRLERGDVLIVTKLDRLGRNAIDVMSTVERLSSMGVKVHCLALGGVDLTSAAGKMTMGVIAAVSQMERDLLIERTNAGIERAKASGKKFGRPATISDADKVAIVAEKIAGASYGELAKRFNVTRSAIQHVIRNSG
ncbi:recombinase family protein [Novosphingobium acidiphilum]|uniref:recombinase family protein n=1 Tax=Novosphingobium acidiphilum TaxID=505248 RepID=UPI00048A5DAC|nr:recombinase family protein [Novosphingobium acidiphilum]